MTTGTPASTAVHHPGPLPLRGVRIVEFEALGPATYAGMLLADMGAEVTRVERPRSTPPTPRPITQRGRHAHVVADLKDAADLAAVRALLASADGLLEGHRPGVMERLGLGPEDVMAAHPRLVYGRVTGWGQTGPLRDRAGHDINYIAATGALHAIGPAERPALPLNLLGDFAGGSLFLVSGLLAGILAARSSGTGCVVDAAMCEGTASLLSAVHQMHATGRWCDARESNLLDGGTPYYRTYACADGRFVAVGALEPKFFATLVRVAGLDARWIDLRDDPTHRDGLRDALAAVFARRPRDEWTALLQHEDACVTPVLTIAESFDHPHLRARGSFVAVDGVTQSAPVPRFSLHRPLTA